MYFDKNSFVKSSTAIMEEFERANKIKVATEKISDELYSMYFD